MRRTGYALLVVGFIGLLTGVFLVRPMARSIVLSHYDQTASERSFTRERVQQEIRGPVFELADLMPWFLLPGAMMLVGAFCLDQPRKS